ncbi:hypothetical protein NQ317_004765, partial [Molorchus minor]
QNADHQVLRTQYFVKPYTPTATAYTFNRPVLPLYHQPSSTTCSSDGSSS